MPINMIRVYTIETSTCSLHTESAAGSAAGSAQSTSNFGPYRYLMGAGRVYNGFEDIQYRINVIESAMHLIVTNLNRDNASSDPNILAVVCFPEFFFRGQGGIGFYVQKIPEEAELAARGMTRTRRPWRKGWRTPASMTEKEIYDYVKSADFPYPIGDFIVPELLESFREDAHKNWVNSVEGIVFNPYQQRKTIAKKVCNMALKKCRDIWQTQGINASLLVCFGTIPVGKAQQSRSFEGVQPIYGTGRNPHVTLATEGLTKVDNFALCAALKGSRDNFTNTVFVSPKHLYAPADFVDRSSTTEGSMVIGLHPEYSGSTAMSQAVSHFGSIGAPQMYPSPVNYFNYGYKAEFRPFEDQCFYTNLEIGNPSHNLNAGVSICRDFDAAEHRQFHKKAGLPFGVCDVILVPSAGLLGISDEPNSNAVPEARDGAIVVNAEGKRIGLSNVGYAGKNGCLLGFGSNLNGGLASMLGPCTDPQNLFTWEQRHAFGTKVETQNASVVYRGQVHVKT